MSNIMKTLSNEQQKKLLSLVERKKKVASLLAKYFNCPVSKLFYKYLKKELSVSGYIDENTSFLFHGYGCTITDSLKKQSIEIEFGPKGTPLAFDKFTLCHLLGYHVNDCNDVVEKLINYKFIELADPDLYKRLETNPEFHNWSSIEQEVDACVVDRYVLTNPKESRTQ